MFRYDEIMPNFIVCHARKIKTTTGLYNVAKHNSREALYDFTEDDKHVKSIADLPDWIVNPKEAIKNSGDVNRGTADQTIKRREQDIITSNLSRKPQKNAAAAIEFVFTASPEWFQNHSSQDSTAFLTDCEKFIEKRYGHILQRNIHFDEQTPHIHVLCTPIVGQKYTSSTFLGGREGLRKLQDDIFYQIGQKWGLERGLEGSAARHDDQRGYEKKLRAYQEAEKKYTREPTLAEKIIPWKAAGYADDVRAQGVQALESAEYATLQTKLRKEELDSREKAIKFREENLQKELDQKDKEIKAWQDRSFTDDERQKTRDQQWHEFVKQEVMKKSREKNEEIKHYKGAITELLEATPQNLRQKQKKIVHEFPQLYQDKDWNR